MFSGKSRTVMVCISSFHEKSVPFVPLPSVLMASEMSRGVRCWTWNIFVRSLLSGSCAKTLTAKSRIEMTVAMRFMTFS
jgi:hypothetical protein